MSATQPLKAAVVGCKMGAGHAECFAKLGAYHLAAVCDLKEDLAKAAAEKTAGAKAYTDFATMLREVRPDVAAIATPNSSHCGMTLQALEAGVKAVCCEKPMAVHLADGKKMVEECRRRGVPLIINHQRRMGADLLLARKMIDGGALGEVGIIRGSCAGDILSDGTHLVDSLLWLAGDRDAEWVLGQVHRDAPEKRTDPAAGSGFAKKDGFRFGHPVETGGIAVIQLKDGPRLELACGDMRPQHHAYQDYQIAGSKGTLWRTGDQLGDNLYICDGQPGNLVAGLHKDPWLYKPVPFEKNGAAPWRAVPLPPEDMLELNNAKSGRVSMLRSYRRFAETIHDGVPHPMSGDNALRGFEIIMAVYESARLRSKMTLPLKQERFPLEIMSENGE